MDSGAIKEEDLKELEEEIDSAVDRLFVPKNPELIESLAAKTPSFEPTFETEVKPSAKVQPPFEMMETSILELSSEMEKSFDAIPPSEEEEVLRPVEDWMSAPSTPAHSTPARPTPARPTPAPSILSVAPEPMDARSSLERLEGQLLTLEWEINKENLEKTRQEVRALKQRGEGGSQGASVLAFMEKVLGRMISHGDTISPALIKFLMDSKETLKLCLAQEGEGASESLKRLAWEGIEARYTCLELSSEGPAIMSLPPSAEEMLGEESAGLGGKAMEEIMGRMNLYFTKMEAGLKKVDEHLALLGERVRHAPSALETKRAAPEAAAAGMSLTLVRVNERLFGVPSDKVVKLFKIPASLCRQVMSQPSIRLKGMDVKIADLRRLFSLPGNWQGKEPRLLIVHHGGKYRGLVIEQALSRIFSASGVEREAAPYSSGTLRWKYQGRPVSVSILDLNQF